MTSLHAESVLSTEGVVSEAQLAGLSTPERLDLLERHSALRSSVARSVCVDEFLERFVTRQSDADEGRLAALLLQALSDLADLKASLRDVPRTAAALLACVACDVLSLSASASALLVRLVADDVSLLREVVRAFRSCSTNSEVACRFASLMAQLLQTSEQGLLGCVQAGAVDCLLELSRTEDELVRGVALDHLASLGHTQEGLKVFADQALPWLLESATGDDRALRAAALAVLAHTLEAGAEQRRNALQTALSGASSAELVHALALNLESRDSACAVSAASCLSALSSDPDALLAVLADQELLDHWLSCLGGSAELQVATLNSVAAALLASSAGSTDAAATEPGKTLFRQLAARVEKLVPFLVQTASRPYADVKQAALNLLSAIASTPWGVTALMNTQGFSDFIVEMSTEMTHEGKHWKYRVLKTLCDNEAFRFAAPVHVLQRFDAAAARGPLFAGSQAAGPVAVERGS